MTYQQRAAWQLRAILLPSVLLLLFLVIWPAVYSVWLSFTNVALVGPGAANPRFVGWKNYARLFGDASFWNSLLVTFWFVLGSAVIGQFVLGLVSAILLNRPLRLRPLINGILLLPNAVPEVVAGFIWISMLAGGDHAVLSRIVMAFGLAPQDWLNTFPLTAIIIVNTWRGIATAMILLTAGLSSVPEEVYEAAVMDGAKPFQVFRLITLPLILPTIFLYMLVSTVSTISIFGFVYALTLFEDAAATEILGIYIFNQSFTAYQLGYGAAVAVISLICSLIVGVTYVRALKVEV